jgi:hypothetical protein
VTYVRYLMNLTCYALCLICFGLIGMASPLVPTGTLAPAIGVQEGGAKIPVALTAIEMDRVTAGAIPVPYPAFGLASAARATASRSRVSFGDGLTGRRPATRPNHSLPFTPLILVRTTGGPVVLPAIGRGLISHEITHAFQQGLARY